MLLKLLLLLILAGCSSAESKSPEEKEKTERETQRLFIGKWRVSNDQGTSFYISINPDGSATSTWSGGEKGDWAVEDEQLILKWNSGWTDVLYREDDAFHKTAYAPGTTPEDSPASQAKAEKVDFIPAAQ